MTDADTSERVAPEIVGWEESPPPSLRASQWDDVVEIIRSRDDYLWAKVKRPSGWHSSSASSFRRRHPDLELYILTPPSGRGNRASEYIWIRRRLPEGEDGGPPNT